MGKLIDCDVIPLGSDSETTVKNRFYLDKLIRINYGFVGTCVDGGTNQQMHNPARFGSIRFLQNGVIYRAFNDGGVNTKAHCDAPVVTNQVIGEISYKCRFYSAFSVNTDNTYIYYRINSGSWQVNTGGSIPANQNLERSYTIASLTDVIGGDTIQLKSSISNQEGVFDNNNIVSFTVLGKAISLKYSSSWPSQAVINITAYAKENVMYSAFYKDDTFLIPYEDGYYVDSSKWYEQRSGVIVASGAAVDGGWPAGDPGNSSSVLEWTYYGFSTISRADATANEFPTPIATIYRRNSDQVWFKNYVAPNTFTNVVDNAYYSAGGITRAYNLGKQMPINWNGPFG